MECTGALSAGGGRGHLVGAVKTYALGNTGNLIPLGRRSGGAQRRNQTGQPPQGSGTGWRDGQKMHSL